MTTPATDRRAPGTPRAFALVAAGALLGAGAMSLMGSAPTQDGAAPAKPAAAQAAPAGKTVPPGRPKPTLDQVKADTKAAMEVLNQFVGRWDVVGQSFDETGKAVGDFKGSAHYTMTMALNFLMGEMTLVNGPYVLDQVDYFGYSPGLRKYTHIMLTELDKSMVYQQGEWMPDAGSMIFAMAAPLDTPRGTPRNISTEYGFEGDRITINMTMQSGTKAPRTVRMLLTRSQTPDAPTGPEGMPTGQGNMRVQYQQGNPAQMQAQMQQAVSQMTAQKQAMAQYINTMNQGWDGQMDQMMNQQIDRGLSEMDAQEFRNQM